MSRLILFTLTFSLFLLLAACTSVDPTPTPTAVTTALRVTAVPPMSNAFPFHWANIEGDGYGGRGFGGTAV